MRKTTTLLAVPVLSASLVLTGCGGGGSTTTTTGGQQGQAASASSSVDPATQCPSQATQSFAKTRFVTNVGLAAGAFYQWIYKPYHGGKFQQGADGRTMAMVKAGLAGAFAAKQVKDATNNVKADPTLCKAFIVPMTKLGDQLQGIGDKIKTGDVAAITGLAGSMTQVQDLAKQKGMEIVPQETKF